MVKETLKNRVQYLRNKGYTFPEIQNELGETIPKSTLSYWCRNVKLPGSYLSRLKKLQQRNWQSAMESLQNKRLVSRSEFIKKTIIKNNKLLTEFKTNLITKKACLAMLYLAEGTKWRSHRGLVLGSSDPDIVELYIKLLFDIYALPKSSLRARISYRADQDIHTLTKYWMNITGFQRSQFYKTIPDPRTIGKPTKNKQYRGVYVITCGGTAIQLELQILGKLLCHNFKSLKNIKFDAIWARSSIG